MAEHYQCTETACGCKKYFVHQHELKTHIDFVQVLPYWCRLRMPQANTNRLCEFRTRQVSDLSEHYKLSHSLAKAAACPLPQCGESFDTSKAANKHMKTAHAAACAKCTVCNGLFINEQGLAAHRQSAAKCKQT
jgi:Zinc finger, C2H2 type